MQHETNQLLETDDEKRPYTPPKLLELGRLTELTQGTSSATNDPGGSQNGGGSPGQQG